MPVLLFSQQTGIFYVRGTAMDCIDGRPLAGTSIRHLESRVGSLADRSGTFRVEVTSHIGVLVLTRTGYETMKVPFDLNSLSKDGLKVCLKQVSNSLDDVQVIGYGTVSRRLNTGSVISVKGADIAKQPVSNPLASLAGRVPGLTVVQNSGNAGSGFTVQIRGRNSIAQGSEPLFLVDGVPFPNGQQAVGMTALANGGQSPMNNINPQDIESIEVLKDADATAIYGSRGANGVVLITTKKGKAGSVKGEANVFHGIGQVRQRLDLLNTQQYLAMRREAFANDGVNPTPTNAPDLLLWDTLRNTDWQDYFIGGTAQFTNARVSLSGGSEQTQFIAGANYNRQGSVYPGNYFNNRGGANLSVSHTSVDRRFSTFFSASYNVDNNELPGSDLTSAITISPNTPSLLDASGNLIWQENGGTFSNPLSYLKRKSSAVTDNLISNINLQYRILPGLMARITGGYNVIRLDQIDTAPAASMDPNATSSPYARFSTGSSKSWIIEPQLEYVATLGRSKLVAMIGTTLQNDVRLRQLIEAEGFANDGIMEAIAYATVLEGETGRIDYRYQALFGRINYNHQGKYLLNLTARRDGSSRFGPNRRIANFGALGLGWVFSEEGLVKDNVRFLSFGKIRASYGVTGNDQIGDYQYLDNYMAASNPYQGQVGYLPTRLFNGDYSWERNKKMEFGLELGFLSDRLQLQANYFQNRSDSQLINYRLPNQVGFAAILRNYGALVQNAGYEFVITLNLKNQGSFRWIPSVNLTMDRNKLLDFPNLESSSYASLLVVGEPLNIRKLLHLTGVDQQTGAYTFNGTVLPADQTVIADLTPKFYGGLNNEFTYKNWQLSFLMQFVKQQGNNFFRSFGTGNAPGTRRNQPVSILDRWQEQGELTSVQRFTTTGQALTAYNNYVNYSDGVITDASFIRLKNVYLAYTFPQQHLNVIKLKSLKCFFQGQNLFTLTNFIGLDPETGGSSVLPPMAVYTFGLNVGF